MDFLSEFMKKRAPYVLLAALAIGGCGDPQIGPAGIVELASLRPDSWPVAWSSEERRCLEPPDKIFAGTTYYLVHVLPGSADNSVEVRFQIDDGEPVLRRHERICSAELECMAAVATATIGTKPGHVLLRIDAPDDQRTCSFEISP
jgi:hypothetical protein